MSAKIKCPVCFHHVPAENFCPRCTRLNASREKLDELFKELGAQTPAPNLHGVYSRQERWAGKIYLLLAAILAWLGAMTALDLIEILKSAEEWLSWKSFLYGGGSFLLFYLSTALAVNKTRMVLAEDFLHVTRGPVRIPLADSFHLSANKIKRVDLYRSINESDSSETCELMIVDENGETYDLFEFDNLSEAIGWYKTVKELYHLEDIQQSSVVRRKVRKVHPKVETISLIYRLVLPFSFALNLPALFLIQEWRFDEGYWLTFTLFTLAVFLVMNFHHRKHLNFWDSHPLEADEEQVGPIFYGVITIIYCLMLTPFAMWIYNWFL